MDIKPEDHIIRHKELHKALDELVADFITHTQKPLSTTSIIKLIEWSYQQTIKPDVRK